MTWMRHSLLILLLFLAGCTLAPHYQRPATPVADAWPTGAAYQPAAAAASPGESTAAELPWRSFIVDPQLQSLIEQALENNRDLRIAVLNIERSRALYRIQRAELFPNVAASAAGSAQRLPKDLTSSGRAETTHQYSVGLGVSAYELDFFGRVQSLKDQALEQYLATEQARSSIQITLIADIVGSYLNLAADRERLALAKETLVNQQEAYKLVESRFEAGISSALDLYQAQTSVDAARVDIARFTTLVAQDENALSQLVGTGVAPEKLPVNLTAAVAALRDITPGLPSEVLLQRPDILQLEHELKGANANIGAARAAFFPRITLVSSIGTGSDELAGLFANDSLAWTFVPRLSLPIFTAGSTRANLEVAEVDREIAIARYEKAIQTAFREIADALAQRGTIDDQTSAQQALTDATAESYRLSTARYQKGIESYLSVLVSERALYNAQQNLISTQLAKLSNLVTLYKVIGGGRG